MKRLYLLLTAVTLVVVALIWHPSFMGTTKDAATGEHGASVKKEATPKEASGKKIKYWVAPMDPTYIRDEPGKSPMGMDLIPVYEGGDEEEDSLSLKVDKGIVQKMGVRTAVVKKGSVSRVLRATGYVTADEDHLQKVATRVDGYVEKLYAKRTGETVKKGQPLYALYAPSLVATQEEWRLARQSGNTLLAQAALRRLKNWGLDETSLRNLRRGGEPDRLMTITSPVSGVITARNVTEGEFVKAGATLFEVTDLSRVWVQAKVFESELPFVQQGQFGELALEGMPDEAFSGEVDFIYPTVDPQTRDVALRLRFENPDGRLRPGMYGTVQLMADMEEEALLIPDEALLRTGQEDFVFIQKEPGVFVKRTVETGVEDGEGNVAVSDGLKEGETIVVSGQFLLDSEARVKEAVNRLLEEKNQSPGDVDNAPMDNDQTMDMDQNDMSGHQHRGETP